MKNILLVLVMLLCACSTSYNCKPIERTHLNLQNPDPLQLADFEFYTVTRDNVEQVFKSIEARNLKPVIIGLSGYDYKILALDFDRLENYIALQKEILKKYREYYEPTQIPSINN